MGAYAPYNPLSRVSRSKVMVAGEETCLCLPRLQRRLVLSRPLETSIIRSHSAPYSFIVASAPEHTQLRYASTCISPSRPGVHQHPSIFRLMIIAGNASRMVVSLECPRLMQSHKQCETNVCKGIDGDEGHACGFGGWERFVFI